MRVTAAILVSVLVACGGGGGGGSGDASGDTVQDTGDPAADPAADTASDSAADDSPAEPECSVDADCDDADPCTADVCDTDYSNCSNEPVDADNDGYPAMEVAATACASGTDCDDSDDYRYPGAPLDCTGTSDMDCDGDPDDDEDSDGYITSECLGGDDCDDADATAFPGSNAVDCSLVDHDCNGEPDVDNDGDGHDSQECGGDDCADGDPGVNPSRTENPCNGKDDDCNGWLYEVEDADHDGYPNATCAGVGMEVDCDDGDAGVSPGVPEICTNVIDEDCDGRASCFVTVFPGAFTMGSPVGEPGRDVDETGHSVSITHAFEVMATEVSQALFESLMAYNPSTFVACGSDCPVEQVNWHEAAAFANALSISEGRPTCYSCSGSGTGATCAPNSSYATPFDCPGYRLPTEAEWEYSARAGTTTSTYAGTTDASQLYCSSPHDVLDPIAWFCGNSGSTTHPSALKAPNSWGLFDMLGNVWEWCQDWYIADPGSGAVTDPWGPASGTRKVIKGGSSVIYASDARAARRGNDTPSTVYYYGIRLVMTL